MPDLKDLWARSATSQAPTMQHPAPFVVPRRRRPRRSRSAHQVLLRRLPKRRSLLQLLKRGSRSCNNRQQKAAAGVTGDVGDCDQKEEMEMEMVNMMKLYLENRCIMEENQRLRKKALDLRHENQILLTQLHHGFQPFSVDLHDNKNSEDVGDVSSAAAGEQLPAHQHQQQPHHGQPSNQ